MGDFRQGEVLLERLLEAMRFSASEPTNEYASPAIVIPLAARIKGAVEQAEVAETAPKLSSHRGPLSPTSSRGPGLVWECWRC